VSDRARFLVLVFIALAIGVGALILVRGRPQIVAVPVPRDPVLPDLVTVPLSDFLIGTEEDTGVEQLRFTATIANIGDGPLDVGGYRQNGSDQDWQVVQWFDEPDGEPSGVDTGANLVYGGHSHEHWHLKFGAVYRLSRLDGDEEISSHTKAGFCFFDQVRLDPPREGAPEDPTFMPDACGKQDTTEISMGMSPGWSDPYFWQLEDQSVEVTGLPDGRYRLSADADPDEWLQESDESNNETWVILEIGTAADGLRSVEVVESAPAAT
jgi:Lysyl oxidase